MREQVRVAARPPVIGMSPYSQGRMASFRYLAKISSGIVVGSNRCASLVATAVPVEKVRLFDVVFSYRNGSSRSEPLESTDRPTRDNQHPEKAFRPTILAGRKAVGPMI